MKMPIRYYYYQSLALSILLSGTPCNAFLNPSSSRSTGGRCISTSHTTTTTTTTTTTLHGITPPTMIIGPMIKKMRDEQEKKKMPLASEDERVAEAPGLKIGTGVWKWPPVWPYDDRLFQRKGEGPSAVNPVANMLMGGTASLSNVADMVTNQGENGAAAAATGLDVKKYWGEEKKDVTTDLSEETVESLKNHYAFYLEDGMSILEFGAAENSYLPNDLKPGRHVGVSLSPNLMEQNPSLTESHVIDLNQVVEEMGVDSDELRNLGENTFDAILMSNTMDFLTHPREVFRTAWRLLKPEGIMLVSFVNKNALTSKFSEAQTNMWNELNDDQHLWVCGSFFQFSASDGWVGLKGFDISPSAANEKSGFPFINNADKPMNMYVVQAYKNYIDDTVDESDPEKSFRSKMWMLPTLEERDKNLLAPRLARAYIQIEDDTRRESIAKNVETLPTIYENLIKMDQFAFPFNLQAQLAACLVSDEDFVANEEQMKALKMGLGLRRPSPEFFEPVGNLTAKMSPEDKIILLSYIVPRFGSKDDDPAQAKALQSFVSGLTPTFDLIRSKCPTITESDVQLLGTEFLVSEILTPGRSTKEEFAVWLNEMTEDEMKGYLKKRKSLKVDATQEMRKMQDKRRKEQEQKEKEMKKLQEQVKKAREERSMVFNEATGKFEEVKKK